MLSTREKGFTVDFDEFKSNMSDPANQEQVHSYLKSKGKYSKSLDSFHAQYFPEFLPPPNSYTPDSVRAAQIKTYTDIKDNKQKEKSKLEEERDNYKRTQLGAEGGKRMTLNFALILFTLVYVLRGLIFTLKWSIKTLKEE